MTVECIAAVPRRAAAPVLVVLLAVLLAGCAAPPMAPDAAGQPKRLAVVEQGGRHVVIEPACPDWRKPTRADFTNTPSSNFGCATAINLGRMVADPADLVAGATLGPADGERASLAVQRYRKGELPAAPKSEKSNPMQLFLQGEGAEK